MSVQKNNPVVVKEGPVVVAEETPTPILSEDQLRSQVAGEYELKMAALEQKLLAAIEAQAGAKTDAPKKNNYDFGVNPFDGGVEKGDTLVHFVEDGFTVGSVVYYRGQETLLPEAQAKMSGRDQVLAYGRVMFRLGSWDGDVYDLEDPTLTEKDKEVLAKINARLLNR